jgi:hypothetical protein
MPDAYQYTTPKYLLPQMEGVPATEPAFYRSLFILDRLRPKGAAADRGLTELTAPVDPFDHREDVETEPALGVLTVHRQGWVQKGIALGNLTQSICLAPGEVTQVAVIDWRRTTTGTSQETSEQAEAVTSDIAQQRAVNEVQRAVAEEAQAGGSSISATSATLQAGLAVSALFASGSISSAVTTSSALTAQFSTGSRNLAAQSTNALSQQTAERSSALRSRRTSIVREVSEKEAETLSTRVLANYNRRHTLNVEYFEVLQLYEIETRLSGWERCLFVPLKPLDFTRADTIAEHKPALSAILADLGRPDLVDRLSDEYDAAARKEQVEAEITRIETDTAEVERRGLLLGAISRVLAAAAAFPALKATAPAGAQAMANMYAADVAAFPGVFTGNLDTEEAATLQVRLAQEARLHNETRARLGDGPGRLARLREERVTLDIALGKLLSTERLFLSQQLWLRMDPYRIYRMLAAYQIGGQPLAILVDPHPVGLFGNYLAFRWGFERSAAGSKLRDEFEKAYLKLDDSTAVTDTIALPTSGVFAEAVLGRGEAAEIKDDTRLWRWKEEAEVPILPPRIAEIASRDRAKPVDLRAADLAAPLAALRATDPASLSYLAGILQQAGNGGMFRNMGGLSEAVGLAEKLGALSSSGASDAGKRAQQIQAKLLDTFVDVLNSDVGKAAVSEFMLPGSGAAVLAAENHSPARKRGGDDDDDDDDDELPEAITDDAALARDFGVDPPARDPAPR